MKVHYNHLKPFIIPDTTSWTLNMKYLVPALKDLGLQIFEGINIHINFWDLSLLTLCLPNGNPKKIFVIPEWYCAPWFSPLRGILKEKTISVKLPDAPDLFIDSFGNNLNGEYVMSVLVRSLFNQHCFGLLPPEPKKFQALAILPLLVLLYIILSVCVLIG